MIYAFKRGRAGFCVVMGISVLISVLIWIRDRNYPVFVPMIATVLMLALGVVAGRLLGNVLASSENTRCLGFLHMELDPKKFIACYREIPDKVRGENTAAICRSYLADGYGADGKYDEAISVGLYAANLTGFYLAKSDLEGAQRWMDRLEEIIDACRLNKGELADNLTDMLRLHRHHMNCLAGEWVDTESLEIAFNRAQYNLRRLEIKKILAMTAIRDKDEAAKKEHLSYLRKNGGLTVYKRWADKQ